MYTHPAPLAATAAALRDGRLDLRTYLGELCDRIQAVEPELQALVPEADRRARLMREAEDLVARFPDAETRPPLFGVPVGVKDILRAEGFGTTGGSRLPPELFAGPEAPSVAALRAAGALILGKTVTAEFAYFQPGPTRNPHNPAHTPGGSSSGSAAAIAAGYCPLALGTQTVGSVIRPAAFCGIVGFKPSMGRISTEGLIYSSPSLDQVGLFTQDVAGAALAATVLCHSWRPAPAVEQPILGVPDGPYLQQVSGEALDAFEAQLRRLQAAGIEVRRVSVLHDIDAIAHRHRRLVLGEMAQVHAAWFEQYEALYGPITAGGIREGRDVPAAELEPARVSLMELRGVLAEEMQESGVDIWVSPAAPGPAPEGIGSTGNAAMNLPWTHAGLPVITVPAGRAGNGLPLGLQCAGRWMEDERLLAWGEVLEGALSSA